MRNIIFTRSFPLLSPALLLCAFLVPILPARAIAAGPFDGMAGAWAGSGSIRLSSGATERLRCQASYAVASEGHTLRQSLRCASDSYNFDLRTNLASNGGVVSGNWTETSHGVQGEVSGRESGGKIGARVTGPNFSAAVSVVTRGAQQSVSIRSPSGELAAVSIVLRHGR